MKSLKILWITVVAIIGISLSILYVLKRGEYKMETGMENYKPHHYEIKTLKNGMKVILVKEETLPYVVFEMLFQFGSKNDPPEKAGLLSLLSELMDKGTQTKSAVETAEEIEMLGAELSYDVERDYSSFSMESLSWLGPEGLSIFADIISKPAFFEEEFKRAKEKAIGFAKRRAENFSSYASRAFNKYLYESHDYGSYLSGSLKSLNNITHEDIKTFYKENFTPDKALLSVSGRYPSDIMERLEQAFQYWTPAKVEKKIEKQILPDVKKTGLLILDHPSSVQSEIRLGHLSVQRSHPDYLPLLTANVILGGSFSSRLMSRVRVQKGLTYGVYSSFSPRKSAGAFKTALAVRPSRTGDALLEILAVIEDMKQNGITKEELKKAQQILKAQFISGSQSAEHFAHYLMYLNNQGIDYSYAEEYFSKLNSLTVENVNTAVKKHFHPDKMKILVLSKAVDTAPQLQDYKPVKVVDYKKYL